MDFKNYSRLEYDLETHILKKAIAINEFAEGDKPEEIAKNYILNHWSELGFQDNFTEVLSLVRVLELQGGTMVWFGQYHNDVEVDGAFIRIKINREGLVRSFNNTTVPISSGLNFLNLFSSINATSKVIGDLETEKYKIYNNDLIVYARGDIRTLAYRIDIADESNYTEWQYFVSAGTGKVIGKYSTSSNVNGTGKVFSPNPTFQASQEYGFGNYIDNNDANNSDLEQWLVDIELKDITEENGIYIVQLKDRDQQVVFNGKYVKQ